MSNDEATTAAVVTILLIVCTWMFTLLSCVATNTKSYYVRPETGQYCVAEATNTLLDHCVTKPLPLDDAKKVADALNRDLGGHASWGGK